MMLGTVVVNLLDLPSVLGNRMCSGVEGSSEVNHAASGNQVAIKSPVCFSWHTGLSSPQARAAYRLNATFSQGAQQISHHMRLAPTPR